MIRDIRQKEFANKWLTQGKFGILNLCPRFGKIRTSIYALENFDENINVLISYPDVSIKKSWQDDFKKFGYKNSNITYTTHLSLKKHSSKKFDVVIIDEIHLLSDNQIKECVNLFENNNVILGLTGTLSKWTRIELEKSLSLPVIAEYSLSEAINENVISDYHITVINAPLDNKVLQNFSGKLLTEQKRIDNLTYVINKLDQDGKASKFLRFARMRVIQNSIGKVTKTKELIKKFENDRVLIFCGTTNVADSLNVPSHHSKSNNKEEFVDFAEGRGNHMAVVKIGNTGVTYKPLNKVIINYFNSNSENLTQKILRCMAFEYNNPNKKSEIYLISSNNPVERKWLSQALEFFDKSKISYE